MTKRPNPVLVLDVERLRKLLFSSDSQTQQLAEAIGKDLNKAVDILNGLIVPYKEPPKQGGRPTKWGRTEQLCAWLAVEIEVQLAQKNHPGIGHKAAMQKYFRNGRVLRACTNISGGPHLEIKSVDSALKNHRDGAALLLRSPDLAARFDGILKGEIARRISAA
jgi:hypothetical protein